MCANGNNSVQWETIMPRQTVTSNSDLVYKRLRERERRRECVCVCLRERERERASNNLYVQTKTILKPI